jgi:hypothetical protein
MDPYFFENYNGKNVTVIAERYIAMLNVSCFCSWKNLVYIRIISSKMELLDEVWK